MPDASHRDWLVWRRIAGDGALLHALSRGETDDALTLGALLAWEAAIEPADLAQETGFSAKCRPQGLARLCIGDLTTQMILMKHVTEQYIYQPTPHPIRAAAGDNIRNNLDTA